MEPYELQEMVYREVRKRLMTSKSSSGTKHDPASVLVVLNRVDPKLGEIIYRLREIEASGTSVTILLSKEADDLCRQEGLLPVKNIKLIHVSEMPRVILDLHKYSTFFFPGHWFFPRQAIEPAGR